MIKKILPISVFVLLLIIILLLGLQNMLNKGKQGGTSSITPTLYQGQQNYSNGTRTNQGNSGGSTGSSSGSNQSYYRGLVNARGSVDPALTQTPEQQFQNKQVINEMGNILPVTNDDFDAQYSSSLGKIIITKKTENADAAINKWATDTGTQDIVNNPSLTTITTDTLDENENRYLTPAKLIEKQKIQTALDFLGVLMNPFVVPSLPSELPPTATPVPKPTTKAEANPTDEPSKPPSGKYVYYSQCGGKYDAYPLPGGCTLCNAGCGPTTVAMIVASYVDSSKTPPKIVDEMKSKNMTIGCGGSGVYDMQSLLRSNQLTVSDYIIPKEGNLQAKDVADDFKGYLKGGWTIFVLANFKTDGGGHYFWVTDVTSDGKILAYDPYYGRSTPAPFNENQYSPAPYYRYAFAVKKK